MNRSLSALSILAIALSMFVGPVGCMRRVRVESEATAGSDYFTPAPTTVLFPQAQQPELVRAAVVRAMAARGYTAESEEPGRIIARYSHGRIELRIQVEYQPAQAVISYLGSEGLRVDRNGRARYYERWVQQLSSSIQDHVVTLSRRSTVIIVQQQPQAVYVQPAPQVYVQPAPQVYQTPPTVVVQEPPSRTMVIEGNVNGANVQGTVYVSP